MDTRLRPAEEDDAAFIFVLTRDALGQYVGEIWGWRDDEQRRYQEEWRSRTPVQIIEVDEEPIGCLAVEERADHIFLNRIALLPSWQGRGIGTRLIRKVIHDAEEAGLPVCLSVLANNPARRLYERLGFRVTSFERPRIKMRYP